MGAFVVVGATSVFFVGAHAGARLNGHINSASVARVPLRDLRASTQMVTQPAVALPEAVAHK